MAGAVRGPQGGVALAFLLALVAGPAAGGTLALEPLGDGPVPVTGVGNAGLSGITWVEGERFLAVDDQTGRMFPLDVRLEASGAIRQIEVGAPVRLEGAKDAEGIARRPGTGTVLVAAEGTHDVREYDPSSGKCLRVIAPPALYQGRIKENKGFESIALAADGSLWIATERPLRRDGRGPNSTSGGLVRLQRFDASFAPAAQYAYRSDSALGLVGVVDLLATPEGELLVLERALTGGGLSARLFRIDFSQATEVGSLEKLRNQDGVRPVAKEKVWERSGGFQNFEGIALGPELEGGGRLVLLISDGGGHRAPHLLALRLRREAGARARGAP